VIVMTGIDNPPNVSLPETIAPPLERAIGLSGAVMLGLGSIIGTGVFVSIGIAAGIAGPAVIPAIVLAALVAGCNALSSAQLAAAYPVSGGTYEYGYRLLTPWLGFSAGWLFVCAKTASAATAALGFAGYLVQAAGWDAGWLRVIALGTAAALTIIVAAGIRLSSRLNMAVVGITLLTLVAFVLAGAPTVSIERLRFALEPVPLLHACALMFVAYTGYGRIATLGEEVRDPHRTIPQAIIVTLVVSLVLYVAVAVVAVGSAGADVLAAATSSRSAPLEVVAHDFPTDVHRLVAVGAMTAMLGVLLNLLLGVSRVLLAMGRRGDMPGGLARLKVAVPVTGAIVVCLAASGSVKSNWSFSAFSVLVYYAITNLAALTLPSERRLYPRWIAVVGLASCLLLAFSIEPRVALLGLGMLAIGLVWHAWRTRTPLPSGKRVG
jgi:basic amino acid/polyamine antiporter, APA family